MRGRRPVHMLMFCPDRADDNFELRSVNDGVRCMVVVPPDQYVSYVLRLHEFEALAKFFAGILTTPDRRHGGFLQGHHATASRHETRPQRRAERSRVGKPRDPGRCGGRGHDCRLCAPRRLFRGSTRGIRIPCADDVAVDGPGAPSVLVLLSRRGVQDRQTARHLCPTSV